jgi:drug/metabolite transporter (DMT)-like permease
VTAAAIALCSSLLWGVADFFGGLLSRRHPVAAIAFLINGVGVIVLGVAAAVVGRIDGDAATLGLAAGTFGAASGFAFYQAMALGMMSIASPLLACGSVLAFGLAVAGGERPSALALVGAATAVGGVVLASLAEHARGGQRRRALGFALTAPLGLGVYFYVLGRASDGGGSISAALGARVSSSLCLLALALWLQTSFRVGWPALRVISLVGIATGVSLLLFGYASDIGLISISSVLASLYPIATVGLAFFFAGERLTRTQLAGVPLALAGVVLVTVG